MLLLGLLVMGLLLLLLLPLGRFPPRVGGEGAIRGVVSGALSGLDVGAAAEGLLVVLCAADGVEGGERVKHMQQAVWREAAGKSPRDENKK